MANFVTKVRGHVADYVWEFGGTKGAKKMFASRRVRAFLKRDLQQQVARAA